MLHMEGPIRNWAFVHTCHPSGGCSVSKTWGEENKGPWGTMVSHTEGVDKLCKRDRRLRGKKHHQN